MYAKLTVDNEVIEFETEDDLYEYLYDQSEMTTEEQDQFLRDGMIVLRDPSHKGGRMQYVLKVLDN